jgi:hypothetical protein
MRRITLAVWALCLATAGASAQAQMKSDGKWHYPDNVKNLCVNYEQSIVSMYRTLIERNTEFSNENLKTDKSQYPALIEAIKKSISEYELSWERLGCTYIIYGAKK